MSDDLLGTVKAALSIVPELHIDDWSMAYTDGLRTSRVTGRMLYALVDRCEQAEAEAEKWRGDYHNITAALVKAEAEVARLKEEAKSYRETNESVAVCANHTEDILYSDDCPCVICELQAARADLAALRQQASDMERGVADALTSAIGDQDMGVVAGVGLLAERYAALRAQRCETCRYASHGDIDLWCEKWSPAIPSSRDVMCADIKGCGAWLASEAKARLT